jgi:hypothetical protein
MTSHHTESKELVTRMRQHLRHLTLLVVTRPTQKISLQKNKEGLQALGPERGEQPGPTSQHLELAATFPPKLWDGACRTTS